MKKATKNANRKVRGNLLTLSLGTMLVFSAQIKKALCPQLCIWCPQLCGMSCLMTSEQWFLCHLSGAHWKHTSLVRPTLHSSPVSLIYLVSACYLSGFWFFPFSLCGSSTLESVIWWGLSAIEVLITTTRNFISRIWSYITCKKQMSYDFDPYWSRFTSQMTHWF